MTLCVMHHHLLTAMATEYVNPGRGPPKKRKDWVLLYLQKRVQYGHYDALMQDLHARNPELYKNYGAEKATVFEQLAPSPPCRLCRVAGTLVLPPTYVITVKRRFLRPIRSGMGERCEFRPERPHPSVLPHRLAPEETTNDSCRPVRENF